MDTHHAQSKIARLAERGAFFIRSQNSYIGLYQVKLYENVGVVFIY